MTKIEFKNLPDTSTPLSADNLNLLQDNVEEAIDNIDLSGDIVVDSIKSKNLFKGFLSGAYNSSTGIFDTTTSGIATPKIEVESGAKYCLSGIQNGNTIRILFWNNNTFVSSTTLTTQTENIITMAGNRFAFQTATTTPYTNIQLEKGEVKTDYKPYENLEGQEFYSGIETKIGTWIDGKPLYRMAIESTSAATAYNINASNVDKIVNVGGMIRRSDYDIWQFLPSRLDSAVLSAQFGNLQIYNEYVQVQVSLGTNWPTVMSRIIIYIEYTKTTD